jgi:hypothetical protein
MAIINTSNGKQVLIDDEDLPRVSQRKWYEQLSSDKKRSYVCSCDWVAKGKLKWIKLHRFILGPSAPLRVDHIDGNPFNNQKANLRASSHAQNIRNQTVRRQKNKTSKFKGVFKCGKKWGAQIKVNQKTISLGRFDDESLAAESYDRAAIQYFGDFAKTNKEIGLLN